MYKLLHIRSTQDLANLIGVRYELLKYELNCIRYHHHLIPKKDGSTRHIHEPYFKLKQMQKQLSKELNKLYLHILPDAAHGMIPKMETQTRGIFSNAEMHVGTQQVLNLDIKDFYGSITTEMIRNGFSGLPFRYSDELRETLAKLTSYQGCLPTGAPTSPVLSNIYCYHIDCKLQKLARKEGLTYTRYADDLTFSGDYINEELFADTVRTLLKQYGFDLNESKTRLKTNKERQSVTGLVVNEKVNVNRKYIRNIRAVLHRWKKSGILPAQVMTFGQGSYPPGSNLKFINHIMGRIDFIRQIRGSEDAIYQRFNKQFISLSNEQSTI